MIQTGVKNNVKLNHGKIWLIKNKVDIAAWIEIGVPWQTKRFSQTTGANALSSVGLPDCCNFQQHP